MPNQLLTGDCLEQMRTLPDACVDLVMCSPPYEAARTYGIGFRLRGQDWVDWCVERYMECLRVCKGLVVWNVEGQTRQFRWSAAPALLMADLHRRGVHLRKPAIFHRVGIPGSGGPDWLRNDYEFLICGTNGGKLPWSDNTAMGHPPKWAPGGEMSNRLSDGSRRDKWGRDGSTGNRDVNGKRKPQTSTGVVPCGGCGETNEQNRCIGCMHNFSGGVNQWGHSINSGATVVDDGGVVRSKGKRPSHVNADKLHTKTMPDGSMETQGYSVPVLANPGNTIQQKYTADEVTALLDEASNAFHAVVGGGCMGSDIAHENEAPYPESLPEFFIRSFCPPDGVVLDPFCGSGTTISVAIQHGRKYIGIDCRASQIALTKRRIAQLQTRFI